MTWLDALILETAGKEAAPFDPTLEALCSGLPPEDAHELCLERASILEHEAGMSRADAARLAGLVKSSTEAA